MSFPQIETELKKIKEEIHEINESIKQIVMQMKLMYITFEGTLKPKQRKEFTPLEIKFPEKINPNSDDEKYIKTYQERLLEAEEELYYLNQKKNKGDLKEKTTNKSE